MQSELLGQSNDLICSVCRNFLHIPFTLPCLHSYCLEPCLLAQKNGENVQCFNCGKCYPLKEATRNGYLEALVTKRLVEEKRNLITACGTCKKLSLDLRDCQHCQVRVCPSCWQSHYDQVVAAVRKSVKSISKDQKVFENIRSKLVTKSSHFSQLEEALENASNDLKIACTKTLARAYVQLDGLSSEYTQRLGKNIRTIEDLKASIQSNSAKRKDIQNMNINELLQVRSELNDVSSMTRDFLSAISGLSDEPNPLGAEISKSYYSLIYPIQSLSLVEEEQDNSISEKDEDNSVDDSNSTSASTTNQIYVGGLIPRISYLKFKNHFSQYGTIKNAFISPSRRFGYVTFSNKESVLSAIVQPFQFIEKVRVEVKPFSRKHGRSSSKKPAAEPGSNITSPKLSETDQRKVFVGGILPFTTKDTVHSTLLKLGPIKRLDFMPQRGFAVVLFEQPATTDLALSTHWYDIDGKRVELLPFVPRKVNDRQTSALSAISNTPSSADRSTLSLADSTPSVDSSSDLRRVFIGGINPKITEDAIQSSLSHFGSIEKVLINSIKGYALVTFKSVDAASEAIAKHWIIVNDKKLELVAFEPGAKKKRKSKQKSESMETIDKQSVEEVSKRKIYVEGIVPPINETILKAYFSKYGAVIFCQITGQRGCLIFDSSKGVEAALKALPHTVLGMNVEIVPSASVSPKSSEITPGASEKDVSVRKLIIKGIAGDITHSVLRDYFSNYGPIDYASIYGTAAWIVFKNAETATLVLNSQPHFIRGRQVSLQRPNNANSPRIGTPVDLSGAGISSPIIREILSHFV